MKLYSEEQVKRAIDEARLVDVVYRTHEEVIDSLTPIELPSDGQIIIMSLPKDVGDSHSSDYIKGFNEGAKWVIEQIKQQDNGK